MTQYKFDNKPVDLPSLTSRTAREERKKVLKGTRERRSIIFCSPLTSGSRNDKNYMIFVIVAHLPLTERSLKKI